MSKPPGLSAETAKARVDKIEPQLKKRVWPPMTYMLIPSVLESADALLATLRHHVAAHPGDTAVQLQLDRLEALRADFRREA